MQQGVNPLLAACLVGRVSKAQVDQGLLQVRFQVAALSSGAEQIKGGGDGDHRIGCGCLRTIAYGRGTRGCPVRISLPGLTTGRRQRRCQRPGCRRERSCAVPLRHRAGGGWCGSKRRPAGCRGLRSTGRSGQQGRERRRESSVGYGCLRTVAGKGGAVAPREDQANQRPASSIPPAQRRWVLSPAGIFSRSTQRRRSIPCDMGGKEMVRSSRRQARGVAAAW